jgi:RNA polymerase sigma-70 factor, ECF subfamily
MPAEPPPSRWGRAYSRSRTGSPLQEGRNGGLPPTPGRSASDGRGASVSSPSCHSVVLPIPASPVSTRARSPPRPEINPTRAAASRSRPTIPAPSRRDSPGFPSAAADRPSLRRCKKSASDGHRCCRDDRALSDTSDNDRLEAIFREHYEAVLAYARRRAPVQVADDVAAETFAIAWRKADQIPHEPLPWLLGVARRVLSTHRRSAQRRTRLRDRLSQRVDPIPPVDVADVRLGEALSQLSEPDQEALLLVAWEGLAPREAAAVVGMTQTGFSVRLHRARHRLRATLDRNDAAVSPARPRSAVPKGEAR